MMAPQYVCDLAELLHGISHIPAGLDTRIFGITLDSRKVKKGDLFIALAGERSDATTHIKDALKNGANAIVVEGSCCGNKAHEDGGAVELYIPELRQWVGVIADRFFKQPSDSLSVVGVTGTNGKTSVSNYIASLFDINGIPAGVIGTLGYGLVNQEMTVTHFTTPDTVEVHKLLAELRDQGAEIVVMEVSSHGLEQGRVDGVRFEGAVFTNLTRDHLDYHGTMENYAAAKQKLFERPELKFVVLNRDDEISTQFESVVKDDVPVIFFGLESDAEISAKNVVYAKGIKADIDLGGEVFELVSALMGSFNLSNLLATIAVAKAKGLSASQIASIGGLKPVTGRMQMIEADGKPLVVVDYAHTPDALENALQSLRLHCSGELVVIFGCGGDRDQGKRGDMASVAESASDKIIVTDDNPRTESPEKIVQDILAGFSAKAAPSVVHNRAEAIAKAIGESEEGDVILVAGKGHEDYQEIDGVKHAYSDILTVREKLGLPKQEVVCD